MDTLDAYSPASRAPDTPAAVTRGAAAVVLGRYRLLGLLGHGGFGTVWLAHDERLGRDVAVKRIPRQVTLAGETFTAGDPHWRPLREAQAAARLNHAGIVALFEAGEDEEAFYLVSELVIGRTLGDLHGQGALTDSDIFEVGVALCHALAHAHARGIVHRDVKPQNIIVPEDPHLLPARAKLTDFGVALVVGADALTRTGDIVGTLAYMAPEQAEGRAADAASDLYSLALVLYEALSGVNPIRAGSPAATARRLGGRIPPLRRARRDLPAAACAAIDRALVPDPGSRGELASLAQGMTVGLHRPPRPAWGRTSSPAARRPGATAPMPDASPPPGRALASSSTHLPRPPAGFRPPAPEGSGLPAPEWPEEIGPPRPSAGLRLVAALEGGALVGVALVGLGPPAPLAPALGAAAAALALALAPRAGWTIATLGIAGWLIAVGQSGMAAIVILAGLGAPLLLPRSPWLWPVAAVAPALGTVGLAAAFPALAGQPRTLARRALLGVLGFWWLALAEPVVGAHLLLGPAPETTSRAAWQGSPTAAAVHMLGPLLSSGMMAAAIAWAAAAAVLPWIVRGRSAALDVLAATAWTAAVGVAVAAVGRLSLASPGLAAGVHHAAPAPRGLVLGAAVAVAVAVALRAVRGPAPGRSSGPGHPSHRS